MDSKSKINIVVIAKANSDKDAAFYELLLKHDSFMRSKAHVYMVSSVDDFANLLSNVRIDFSFILFIHKGNRASNPSSDGNSIVKSLKKLPYHDKLTYYMLSRDAVGQDIDAMDFLDEEYKYDQFVLNNIGDLLEIKANEAQVNKIEHYDFAILTALDKDENDVFRANLKEESQTVIDLQTVKGAFKKQQNFKDYEGNFIVAKQKEMGMVDAAFSSSKLIHNYKLDYLIMSGVCGGRKSKVKMFDIIIPKKVYDFSFGSLEKGKFLQRDLDAKIDDKIISYLDTTERIKQIKAGMLALVDTMNNAWEPYVRNVDIHFDVMACGPWVIKTEDFLETLSQEKNNLIRGLEMESYSIGRAYELFKDNNLKTLVVKSVMDYTDTKKGDEFNGVPVKKLAGYMSYLCVRAIMPMLIEYRDQFHKQK